MDLERECDVPFKSYTWKVLGTHVLGGNLEGPDLIAHSGYGLD